MGYGLRSRWDLDQLDSPWEHAQDGEGFITMARQKLAPLKEKIILLEKEKEILPGVEVLFAPGHTPGHRVVSFVSQCRIY